MMPVAVGGAQRFVELVIDNVLKMSWSEFANCYSERLNEIKSCSAYSPAANENAFLFSQFIGNLPKMRFTGFKIHSGRDGVQNIFYFGKRARDAHDKLTVPFAMNLHHANADPVIGQQVIEYFDRNLLSLCKNRAIDSANRMSG
jgi:chloramphenicol O-acetyltransferase